MGFQLNIFFLLSLEMTTGINDPRVLQFIEESVNSDHFPTADQIDDNTGASLLDQYIYKKTDNMSSGVNFSGYLLFNEIDMQIKYIIANPKNDYNIIICYVFGKYYYARFKRDELCCECRYVDENKIDKYIPPGYTLYTIKSDKFLRNQNMWDWTDAYSIVIGLFSIRKEAIEKKEIVETEFSIDLLTNPPQAKYAGKKQ
jgi:hypothetical protein